MRKRILSPTPQDVSLPDEGWINLEAVARVEITSEDPAHPIESALLSGPGSGWRAAQGGEQTIRLLFDRPQRLKRISLLFVETEASRTQEFVLRWSPDDGRSYWEIVRQQWNFSPPGTTHQVEDYRLDLPGVTALELTIIPDIGDGEARASLAQLRLA
jgi:hypothetical protein